jgi:hypothetical protein
VPAALTLPGSGGRVGARRRTWSPGDATSPDTLADYVAVFRECGQTEATPLLLTYGPGGMNALHQDKYGAVAFPLQVMVMLSEPEVDFTGGTFILEERHDDGTIASTELNPGRGSAVVFPNQCRPDPSASSTRTSQRRVRLAIWGSQRPTTWPDAGRGQSWRSKIGWTAHDSRNVWVSPGRVDGHD